MTATALLGLFGGTVLHAFEYHGHLPLFGEYHLATPVLFDFGVYLLVLGVVLDIVRALGAKVDRQIERAAAEGAGGAEGAIATRGGADPTDPANGGGDGR